METRVRTPHDIFFAPQQLLVPLFQRPYVWSQEGQWEPLWEDVQRQAERLLETGKPGSAHFLGAAVLQHQDGVVGGMPRWTIIDGQQRLTSLQLLLDAAHQVCELAGAPMAARQLEDLVRNPPHFCKTPADALKVWPTNRDRAAFNEVMTSAVPVEYDGLADPKAKMALGHKYFSGVLSNWLEEASTSDVTLARANALAHVLLNELQLVVIQLAADEDAQEIFETLNARGTALSAADLIKNFVFQRLGLPEAEAEAAYIKYWRDFETAFWEQEVSAGRTSVPRSSLFLNQWLVARTGVEVTAKTLFSRFKRYAAEPAESSMATQLPGLHATATTYRSWTEAGERLDGSMSQLELFVYRSTVLESETVKPLLIWATDPTLTPLPDAQLSISLASLESWLVRRALLRLSSKGYNRLLADLVRELKDEPRDQAGDVVRRFLAQQDSVNTHWPGDEEVRTDLASLPAYRRYRKGRLRMILEAIEDHERGFRTGTTAFADGRVRRNHCAIEHLMPQQWETHWPVGAEPQAAVRRDAAVHLLGNLTLLTTRLNSKVSNGAWLGPTGKLARLDAHDVLLLNRRVRKLGEQGWDEQRIRERTKGLIETLLEIWPVPEGHVGLTPSADVVETLSVSLADLVREGLVTSGQTLFAKGMYAPATALVLSDGRLQVEDDIFDTPSGAARAVASRSANGWSFWLTAAGGDENLRDLRNEYAGKFGADAVADDDQDADEEEL